MPQMEESMKLKPMRVAARVKPVHADVHKPKHSPPQQQVLQRAVVLLQPKKDNVLRPVKQLNRARLVLRVHFQRPMRLRVSKPVSKQVMVRHHRLPAPSIRNISLSVLSLRWRRPRRYASYAASKSSRCATASSSKLLVCLFRRFGHMSSFW